MKKILSLVALLILLCSVSAFAQFYSEFDVNGDFEYLTGAGWWFYDEHHDYVMIDFGLRNYANVPLADTSSQDNNIGVPAMEFLINIPITEMVSVALYGYFWDQMDGTVNTSQTDPDGETRTRQRFTAIDNALILFVTARLDTLDFGVFVGGGTNFANYREEKATADWGGTDGEYVYKEIDGYGFIQAGFGFFFDGSLFNDAMAWMVLDNEFTFRFGNGLGTLVSVNPYLLDAGGNGTFVNGSGQTVYEADGADTTIYDQETYEYFEMNWYGWLEPAIDLNDYVSALGNWDRFRLRPSVDYGLSLFVPTKFEEYDSATEALTVYSITNIGGLIGAGLELDMMPNDAHRFRLRYRIRYDVAQTDFTWTVDGESIDANYSDTWQRIRHEIKATYRITFPKVVYLELEARYRINQNFYDSSVTDDAGEIIADASGDYKVTYSSLSWQLRTRTRLGFDLGVASLRFTWLPIIGGDFNADPDENGAEVTTTQYINSTNILNLANWDVSVAFRFDPWE